VTKPKCLIGGRLAYPVYRRVDQSQCECRSRATWCDVWSKPDMGSMGLFRPGPARPVSLDHYITVYKMAIGYS